MMILKQLMSLPHLSRRNNKMQNPKYISQACLKATQNYSAEFAKAEQTFYWILVPECDCISRVDKHPMISSFKVDIVTQLKVGDDISDGADQLSISGDE